MQKFIETDRAPRPIGPYSQAVCANGFIFLSGQIPLDPETGLVANGGIEAQTHRVIKNIAAVLEAAGANLGRVVKTTVFLANMDDFPRFNEIYAEYFGETKPARATVQATRLPKDVLLEIEAVALA